MSLESTDRIAFETEITLLICSDRPEEIEEELSGLSAIRGYHLAPASSVTLDDAYLDTDERALSANHYALRIRRSRSDIWITLKGPSHPTEWGGLERLEMEALWSPDALDRVLRELQRLGLLRRADVEDFDPVGPLETMKSLGFTIIQKRSLLRRCKAVTDRKGGSQIAELAIDDVTYQFASGGILHSEVEIEAKGANTANAVRALADGLIERYGPELQRWRHGKLATGHAIEELVLAGRLNDLMNGHRLRPAAYTIITEWLKTRKAP
ncbi:MAG: CYTH domain-containing protein [Desulfomonile tiedjei]|nr:CYTH domain-containing protein [Desulfomonile tiedjei]